MVDFNDLVTVNGIIPSLQAKTKKQCLQELASFAASEITGLSQRTTFEALLQRERLGSTGLGRGIAVPHVKLKNLERIVCLFARAETPIDFDAPDGEPVDLIFLVLAPEHASGDHLKVLSRICRLLREPNAACNFRTFSDKKKLIEFLKQPTTAHAA